MDGATLIEFSITNYHNPPSTRPLTTMKAYTTLSDETTVIDEDNSISLTMTTLATLDSTGITITPEDSEINVSTNYDISLTVGMPLSLGSTMTIVFPDQISPGSNSVTVLGTSPLSTLVTTNYNSTSKTLTLSGFIPDDTVYIDVGDTIYLSILNVTNPSTTAATDSFTFTTYNGVQYGRETVSTDVTVTATPGDILSYTVTPITTEIRESTIYRFTFETETDIPASSTLTITFPDEITVDESAPSNCVSTATQITAADSVCTVSGSVLTISDGFLSDITAGSSITFSLQSVATNANTTATTSYFQAQFDDSSGNTIDQYDGTDVTLTFVVNELQAFTITPQSDFTGVETTYDFFITVADDKTILQDSILQIVFPAAIEIGDETTSAAS